MKELKESLEFWEELIDTIPAAMFVVDDDVRIRLLNRSARNISCKEDREILDFRGGEVLGCINASRAPGGCGKSGECSDCVLRESVRMAFQGEKVYRRQARMTLVRDGRRLDTYFLVTASPFTANGERLILLSIEDISELTLLRRIIPICSVCKKIRDDEDYWQEVDRYFANRLNVDFSHGLCRECAGKYYRDFIKTP